MNYYRRYVGDYQRKTMRLDPTDHGVYDLMLDYYYAEELPLPLELDDIHAICKAIKPEHRKSVTKVLGLYFERREDGYHNRRADEEIAVSKQARTNGRGHTGGTGKATGSTTGQVTDRATGEITGKVTGDGGGSVHPPTTNHQPPAVNRQPPTRQPLASTHQPRAKSQGRAFALPAWIPHEPWASFVEMRQRIRKPMTTRSMELIIAKLDTLRGQGHAPTAVIEQSVEHSWVGVFPVKENGHRAGPTARSNFEAVAGWKPPEEVKP